MAGSIKNPLILCVYNMYVATYVTETIPFWKLKSRLIVAVKLSLHMYMRLEATIV